jgi:hypothetical protein
MEIAATWDTNKGGDDPGEALQKAVEKVMDELPTKKRELSGWMDLNYEFLAGPIEERNAAATKFASAKTEEARLEMKAARKLLKRKKKVAKNRWLSAMLQECNGSTLPGGGDGEKRMRHMDDGQKVEQGGEKMEAVGETKHCRRKRGARGRASRQRRQFRVVLRHSLYERGGPRREGGCIV